jgi:hypothetical protein
MTKIDGGLVMRRWVPIRYRGFWDVPRIFVATHNGQTFLFDCRFDEELDNYPESYRVYTMPSFADDELPTDWTTLCQWATGFLGEVPVARVQFDPTRRREIDSAILEELIGAKKVG